MTVAHRELRLDTTKQTETIDITDRVARIVGEAGVAAGICVVTVAHTTAGIFVNENADPDVQRDILTTLARLVPGGGDYRHAEGNSPAHIRAVLVGADITVAIEGGKLALGRWQGVYFAEFDGPRRRRARVTLIGDAL